MADLHVYCDDYEWWVATDAEDAAAQQRQATGLTVQDQTDMGEASPGERFQQLDDDADLTIVLDEGSGERVTKTCRAWAAENGRGYLCGTEV